MKKCTSSTALATFLCAQEPHVAGGSHTGLRRYKIFPPTHTKFFLMDGKFDFRKIDQKPYYVSSPEVSSFTGIIIDNYHLITCCQKNKH